MPNLTPTNNIITGDLMQISSIEGNLSSGINIRGNITVPEQIVEKDYDKLINKPAINGHELQSGENTLNMLEGIQVVGNSISPTNRIANIPAATTSAPGAMTAADKTKLDGIDTGAQVNVIESIKKNGSIVSVVNKTVDIAVPTIVDDLADGSNYATKSYVDINGGKIDKIKVNNVEQAISSIDKSVNIAIPIGGSSMPAANGIATPGSAITWAHEDHVHPNDSTKVDKVEGKGLSTEDYTTEEKTKLSGIASGAQVNVVTDVSASGSGAQEIISISKGADSYSTYAKSALDITLGELGQEIDSKYAKPSDGIPSSDLKYGIYGFDAAILQDDFNKLQCDVTRQQIKDVISSYNDYNYCFINLSFMSGSNITKTIRLPLTGFNLTTNNEFFVFSTIEDNYYYELVLLKVVNSWVWTKSITSIEETEEVVWFNFVVSEEEEEYIVTPVDDNWNVVSGITRKTDIVSLLERERPPAIYFRIYYNEDTDSTTILSDSYINLETSDIIFSRFLFDTYFEISYDVNTNEWKYQQSTFATEEYVERLDIPELSDSNPAALAVSASAGISDDAARADHIHPLPSAAAIGAYTKPSGGIPKSDLASDVQTSLRKADSALQSFTEVDPTVPSWAKASSKPSYTASEVGAVAISQGSAHAGEFVVVGSDGNIITIALSSWQGGTYGT